MYSLLLILKELMLLLNKTRHRLWCFYCFPQYLCFSIWNSYYFFLSHGHSISVLSGWRVSHLLHSKCLLRHHTKILIPFTAPSPSSHPELFVHVQARVVVYLVWWFLFLCTCEYAKEAKNDHTGLALLLFLASRTVCLLNYNLPSRIQLMRVPPSHIISSLFMETARDMGCSIGLCRSSTENRAGWSWQCFPGFCSDHLAVTQPPAIPSKSWCPI